MYFYLSQKGYLESQQLRNAEFLVSKFKKKKYQKEEQLTEQLLVVRLSCQLGAADKTQDSERG